MGKTLSARFNTPKATYFIRFFNGVIKQLVVFKRVDSSRNQCVWGCLLLVPVFPHLSADGYPIHWMNLQAQQKKTKRQQYA